MNQALSNVLSRLKGVRHCGNGWKAHCPAHDDRRQSLHVSEGKDGRILAHCHAGCSIEDICAAIALTVKDLFPEPERKRDQSSPGKIMATYDYKDANGKLLFQVCRTAGKRFFQRRPDGKGGWVNGLGDVKPVLYRLPELLQAVQRGDTIFIPEGEKDVDNLARLGLTATTSPMGAGKWRDYYSDWLKGANVAILPDNDQPGRKHAQQVAKSLHGKASSVKVLELPGLPAKGDVSDWLAAGGTKEELLKLAQETPEWEPGDEKETKAHSILTLPVYASWLEALSKTRYRADRNGNLCYVKYTEKGGEEEIVIANFLARPVREVTRDNGADREIEFEIAGILAGGHELPTARVAAKDFASLSWVPVAWGLGANVEPGQGCKDRVRHAIQCLARDVAREIIYTHLGWRKIGSEWLYLHAGGAIGARGPAAGVAVDPGEKLKDHVLPNPSQGADLAVAVRASLALLHVAPAGITYPLLAAVYRAPLAEALPVDLSIFLSGQTGAKKTELTALAQAHWGAAFHGKNLPGNWDSTANALEKLAFLAKDAIFTVDDFAPKGTASDVQRLHREADRLMRAQGNLAGRSRMRADGSLRPEYVPRGLIVSSGEDIPRGQSLRARGLILEVGPADVDLDRLTEAQQAARRGLLAAAMFGYVQWLAARMDDLKANLRERHEDLRTEARKTNFVHDRTPDIVANLAIGWEQFLLFATETGAIEQEKAAELWRECWDALLAAGEAQAGHLTSEEPVRRFLALLGAAITSGKAHVADARTGGEPKDPATWGWQEQTRGSGEYERTEYRPLGDDLVGWLDGDDLLLDPEAAYATAQKLARDQNSNLPVTQRVLWKRMAEKGLLLSTAPGKNVSFLTIPALGKRRYVVHISTASLLFPISGTIGTIGTDPHDKRVSVPKKCARNLNAPVFQAQKIGTETPVAQGVVPIVPEVPEMQYKRPETFNDNWEEF